MASVDALRVGFQSLLPHGSCTLGEHKTVKSLSQGDMLLMGFNGLFDNVQLGRETLLAHLSSLQSPLAWKIVDQVREAKSHYIVRLYFLFFYLTFVSSKIIFHHYYYFVSVS